MTECTQCKTPLAVEQNFCPGCGSPTPRSWQQIKEQGGTPPSGLSAATPNPGQPVRSAQHPHSGGAPSTPFSGQVWSNPAVPNPHATPDLIDGRFQVINKLGEGGFGVVYKVYDLRLDNVVKALKLLKTADTSVQQNFLREMQILLRLNHQFIVPIRDTGVDPRGPYYTMDFCPGKTLRQVLNQGDKPQPLPLDRFLRLARHVLEALAYAHKQNVLHRDLKPPNVMVVNEGDDEEARILDFGIGKILDTTGQTLEQSLTVGTPAYMAPEQFLEEGRVDVRTDVYNVAATFYELLSAQAPFRGETPYAIFEKIKNGPPEPWPQQLPHAIPKWLEDALLVGMSKDRNDRFTSAQEFLNVLLEGERGQPRKLQPAMQFGNYDVTESLPRVSGKTGSNRARKPRPKSLPLIAVVLVLLAGAAAWVAAGPSMLLDSIAEGPVDGDDALIAKIFAPPGRDVLVSLSREEAGTQPIQGRFSTGVFPTSITFGDLLREAQAEAPYGDWWVSVSCGDTSLVELTKLTLAQPAPMLTPRNVVQSDDGATWYHGLEAKQLLVDLDELAKDYSVDGGDDWTQVPSSRLLTLSSIPAQLWVRNAAQVVTQIAMVSAVAWKDGAGDEPITISQGDRSIIVFAPPGGADKLQVTLANSRARFQVEESPGRNTNGLQEYKLELRDDPANTDDTLTIVWKTGGVEVDLATREVRFEAESTAPVDPPQPTAPTLTSVVFVRDAWDGEPHRTRSADLSLGELDLGEQDSVSISIRYSAGDGPLEPAARKDLTAGGELSLDGVVRTVGRDLVDGRYQIDLDLGDDQQRQALILLDRAAPTASAGDSAVASDDDRSLGPFNLYQWQPASDGDLAPSTRVLYVRPADLSQPTLWQRRGQNLEEMDGAAAGGYQLSLTPGIPEELAARDSLDQEETFRLLYLPQFAVEVDDSAAQVAAGKVMFEFEVVVPDSVPDGSLAVTATWNDEAIDLESRPGETGRRRFAIAPVLDVGSHHFTVAARYSGFASDYGPLDRLGASQSWSVEAIGASKPLAYDAANRVVTITDPKKRQTRWRVPAEFDVVDVREEPETDTQPATLIFSVKNRFDYVHDMCLVPVLPGTIIDGKPVPDGVQPFLMDQYEVTVLRYDAFFRKASSLLSNAEEAIYTRQYDHTVDRLNLTPPIDLSAFDVRQDEPIYDVTWLQALAFADQTRASLPMQYEWEIAAGWDGSETQRTFPWGERFEDGGYIGAAPSHVEAVGAKVRDLSPWRIHGMAGGVREWCRGADRDAGRDKPTKSWATVRSENSQGLDHERRRDRYRVDYGRLYRTTYKGIGFRCVLRLDPDS